MLENWLRLRPDIESPGIPSVKKPFGHQVIRFDTPPTDLSKVRVALIGIDAVSADAVRRHLYGMSFPWGRLKVADLGNLRKTDVSFLVPLIRELLEGKITPVLIGQSPEWVVAQYKAHQSGTKPVSWAFIHNRLPFHPSGTAGDGQFLTPLLSTPDPDLFQFSALCGQSHFMDAAAIQFLEDHHFECIRLGDVRAKISEIEPVVRDADLVSFDLSAIRQSDAPGVHAPGPSGLFLEEACQICRYAGLSDKLTSIGFYGYSPESDRNEQTAHGAAQLIWYFLDGYFNRKNDFPISMTGLVEYIVDFKKHDYQITFWKSTKSGRWWLQVPVKTKRNLRRHRLIPCSYEDYLNACKEELPDRLWRALRRFDVG
ncbi:MAG: formiminoglutamase [Bacteroidetes bacterium]|nr:MAG: formiminoglutamase [Bacteroidota bacterium]